MRITYPRAHNLSRSAQAEGTPEATGPGGLRADAPSKARGANGEQAGEAAQHPPRATSVEVAGRAAAPGHQHASG